MGVVMTLLCLATGDLHAQDSQQIPEGRLTNGAENEVTGNTNGMPPKQAIMLPLDAGNLPDQGEVKLSRLPAHTAFRGLMDSAEYKKMLKDLITSEVPVMYQTMMMVENGAATGFMGSVQSVSQLLSNSMQSAQLELAMRRVAGPDAEKQYVNAVYDGLKENKDNGEYLWPVGLYYASGDKITEQLDDQNHKLKNSYKSSDEGGASIVQHLPEDERGNEETKWKLSKVLFGESSDDQRLNKIKKFFTDVVGDVEFERENDGNKKDNPAVMVNVKYIKPELKAEVEKAGGTSSFSATTDDTLKTMSSVSTMNSDEDTIPVPDEVYGVNVKRENLRKETWKQMYEILQGYCEFKQQNRNQGQELFKKIYSHEYLNFDQNRLDKVSSKNLKVSLNVVDQIFKIWVQTSTDSTQPTKIDCKFENAEEEMPKDTEGNDGGDSCDGAEKARKCRRNKWLYRLVDAIALDKLIEEAKDTYEKAMQKALALDASTSQKVAQLFCHSFLATEMAGVSEQQCDIGFYFDSISGANRQRWSDQLEASARLAQSLGGSSNFRFQPNNSLSAAGGSYDSAGDADPAAGGGGGS